MSMTEAGNTDAGPAAQPSPTGFKSGLIAYFADNPVAANLLMVLLIVGGVLSGHQLVVQYYPDIEARRAAVSVLYPGASPLEVKESINRRIEESVVGLPGVERVVSNASQGLGKVTVEMATFADADAVFNDIQSAIDRIENFPPVKTEQQDVELLKVSHEVMTPAVVSSTLSENALHLAAEDLRDRVLEQPSISQVTLKGNRRAAAGHARALCLGGTRIVRSVGCRDNTSSRSKRVCTERSPIAILNPRVRCCRLIVSEDCGTPHRPPVSSTANTVTRQLAQRAA